MGFDVYGRSPTSETGEYFRRSVWSWRPLADYILKRAPKDLTGKCKYWHTNDGAGLNARDSLKLADFLQTEIDTGQTAAYLALRDATLAALPNVLCRACNGTGIRTDEVGRTMKQHLRVIGSAWGHADNHPRYGRTGWCNGCDGTGSTKPWDTHYSLDVKDVQEFTAFLRDCGGFKIH